MTNPALRNVNGPNFQVTNRAASAGAKPEAENSEPQDSLRIGTGGGIPSPEDVREAKEKKAAEKNEAPKLVIPKTATSGAATAPGILTIIEEDDATANINRFEGAEAEDHKPEASFADRAKKYAFVGVGAGVALAGLANASPAMAQTATVRTSQATRSQTPVRLNSVDEVRDAFSAENQLYVIGNPKVNGHPVNLEDFQRTLAKHPNMYVVINGNTSTNDNADTTTVLRGIGNHSEFLEVREAGTGEQNGALFFFNLDAVNHPSGRTIYMRSQGLPDQLGVGEDAFMPNGNPALLGRIFVDNFKNEGMSLGGSMEEVYETINNRIASHVSEVVGSAQSNVASGQTALDGVQPKIRDFQRKHGSGGTLGSPDVEAWQSQMRQAQEALQNKDFATASRLAGGVVQSVRAHEQAMANYEQAPAIRAEAQALIDQTAGQLEGLPDNSQAAAARSSYADARQALEAFDTAYEAKDASFNGHLQRARSSAASAVESVQASKDAADTAKKVKLYGAAAVTTAILATGIVMNRMAAGKGKEAKAELEEATAEIAEKSKDLLSLMENADFNTMAGFTGETKKLADQVMDQTLTALTLVGGAEKFLAEAETLINGKGLGGKIKNLFLKGNYQKAIDLLKLDQGGQALQFDTRDSTRAVMEEGSKAADWRDQILKAGSSRQFEKTLRDVLLTMAENYDSAKSLHEQIEHKNAKITNYLGATEEEAKSVQATALQLQTAGQADGMFVAPSITEHLLETVLADEKGGGLVAKGRSVGTTDPVRAWNDFGDPAKRMTTNAKQALELASEARSSLLPTIQGADEALHPHGVKTEWAHDQKKSLSEELDDIATKAVRTDVSGDISSLKKNVFTLESRVKTVVDQDHTRREVSPKKIASAKDDVASTRQQVFTDLQAMGAFRKGSADQILREPERDPSDRTADADQNLADIKPMLDVGNIEQAGTHIENIENLTQDAHRLARETREALVAYPKTLDERQGRHTAITGSVKKTYAPSMERIKAGYVPKVMQQVAQDVGAGDTLADNITDANSLLDRANKSTLSAVGNFDRAYLLTSRDELNSADADMVNAQKNLDSVTQAEALLAKKQGEAESELSSLRTRMGRTQSNAGQHFVRSKALNLFSQAQAELGSAGKTVNHAVKSPYDAHSELAKAENLRQQTESAIAADQRAYEAAKSEIASAGGQIATATAMVSSASGWSDSTHVSGHGTVSTSIGSLRSAKTSLTTAAATLATAQAALGSKNFEEAERLASSASSQAGSAYTYASSALSSAKREHSSKVSSAKAEVQRKKDEEAAAERRRQQQEASRRNNSSGGGFGGGGGHGGTGGGF